MEKEQSSSRGEFAKKWKINELRNALVVFFGSIGLMAGALSISLVGQVEGSEIERIRVKGSLENGSITIDPELQPNESLLVTIPDSAEMRGQSVRLAEGRDEPPYMETIYAPAAVWRNINYLLAVDGGDEITEYQCEVDPESIMIEHGSVGYVLECE